MSQQQQQQQQQADNGGPYPPRVWQLGGAPKVGVDVPITAVFLVLFFFGAAAHMTIFQINMRKGHKFLMSALLFGFCMARIASCIMRIAWTIHFTNISLGIAAQVFVAVGVIIIYFINLIFAQRMIRASHPRLGWSSGFSIAFKVLYGLIVVTIIMLVTVTIQSFFTLNTKTRRIDRDIQLYGVTMFAILSFLPIPMVLAVLVIPRSSPLDKFGRGRWRTKISILLAGATLVCFGASYRAGASWMAPRPFSEPLPGYLHKAAFYMANFGVEILTVYLYAILRVDNIFHVPDGAKSRRSYISPTSDAEKADIPEADARTLTGEDENSASSESKSNSPRVYSEKDTSDDQDIPNSSVATLIRETPPTTATEKDTEIETIPLPAHPATTST